MPIAVNMVHNPGAFKKDDIVKVVRKVGSVQGWKDNWNGETMDRTVGKTGTITIAGDAGFKVRFDDGAAWYYPSCALEMSLGGGNVATNQTSAVAAPAKKKRVRVKPDGPWDAAPCTHLRWNLMGFFREKLAVVRTSKVVTLSDGSVQDVGVDSIDIACTKCNTKMTLKAKG